MTAHRHAAIAADSHDPCPFCGCGPLTAGARTAPRRARLSKGRTDPHWRAFDRTAYAFGTLPADWAYPIGGTRELTAEERAYSARWDAIAAEHRGQIAIVDERTNTIGWRDAPGAEHGRTTDSGEPGSIARDAALRSIRARATTAA